MYNVRVCHVRRRLDHLEATSFSKCMKCFKIYGYTTAQCARRSKRQKKYTTSAAERPTPKTHGRPVARMPPAAACAPKIKHARRSAVRRDGGGLTTQKEGSKKTTQPETKRESNPTVKLPTPKNTKSSHKTTRIETNTCNAADVTPAERLRKAMHRKRSGRGRRGDMVTQIEEEGAGRT